MRTIIAGSRGITDFKLVENIINNCIWEITTVISGGARGIDKLGELWAEKNNIPCEVFPADWDTFGKKAGYLRNIEMANTADALIVIWDGLSKGTKHMLTIAKKKKLKIYLYIVDN